MDTMIRGELERRGWTVAELGRRVRACGPWVTDEAVRGWVTGRTMPSFRHACALSDVFGWDRSIMFRASGYMEAL